MVKNIIAALGGVAVGVAQGATPFLYISAISRIAAVGNFDLIS